MVGVESLTRSIEFVYNRLQSLPAARHLAEECHRARVRDEEVSGFFDHIANTVSNHLHSIAHGRIVTLGRRFALGEVLFDAYRNGHMPFGKDPDTGHILCIAGRGL
jgi:hypothetical protein